MSKANCISWVFFDVGNVLLNDDVAMAYVYEMLYEEISKIHRTVTFDYLISERERLIVESANGQPHRSLGKRFLGEEGWQRLRLRIMEELNKNYEKYHLPVPGANTTLKRLYREYHLGVAANQVPACRQALAKYGLKEYLSIIWLSEEIGLSKPAPRFYEALLEQADCRPEKAVMIGDRIDYDVVPPNSIGMKTIQVRLDFGNVRLVPISRFSRVYFDSLNRVRVSQIRPTADLESPDLTVTSLEEIPAGIELLCQAG